METIQSVGIIGLGSFGQFLASLMPSDMTVLGSSRKITQLEGVKIVPLEEVVQADVVILGFPLDAYETMLQKIAPLLPPNTLVVDVCSVKVKPEKRLAAFLPEHVNILSTHPLFGPQSAAHSTKGHKLVVTADVENETSREFLQFCEKTLKLDISHMTAEEHDRIMARVHALTFFVARGLTEVKVGQEPFMTPSYQKLLDLAALDQTHSQELFDTIENGNPFARKARQELIIALENIDKILN